MRQLLACLGLLVLSACTGSSGSDSPFLTADAHGIGFQIDPLASGGSTASSAPGTASTQSREQVMREVAEADIFQVDGDTAYLLNTWRGLAIVDLAQLELRGRLPLPGWPVELYRRGSRAFVLLSAVAAGLQLLEIDVADPAAPSIVATAAIDGAPRTSRLVGDLLYVLTDAGAAAFDLAAAPFAARSQLRLLDSVAFAHATDQLLFLASGGGGGSARITLLDISDPQGSMALRGTIELPGVLADDKKLDCRGTVLRAVTADATNQLQSHLFTVDVADPDAPRILASLTLAVGEQLFGTEFTATRAYVVTFQRIDPLWVIDLTDPARPYVAGELQVPGYSTQLVADGDQLVAYGVEPRLGGGNVVSLFDVADPAHPSLLARQSFGDTSANALSDRKSFHVFADVVLVPTWEGVAVVDRSPTSLLLRGIAPMIGGALRAFPYHGELVAFGDETLVAFDRSTLAPRGSITLASNVVDVARRSDGAQLDLVQRGSNTELAGAAFPLYADGMHVYSDRAAVTGWDDHGRAAYVVDCSTTPATVSPRLGLGWGGFACPVAPASMRAGAPASTAVGGFLAPSFFGPDTVLTATGKLVLRGLPSGAPRRFGSGDASDGLIVLDIPTATLLPGIEVRTGAITGFVADGDGIAFSIGRFVRNDDQQRPLLRHELVRLDLAHNAARLVGDVPGYLVALDGNTAFTVEERWGVGWQTQSRLVAADIAVAPAVLSQLPLPNGAFDFRAAGNTLCYAAGGAMMVPILRGFDPSAPMLPDYRIDSVRLGRTLSAGPAIAEGAAFRSLLLVEDGGVLLARDGFSVEHWDLRGAAATQDFANTLRSYVWRAHADPTNPGHYLLPMGYAGTAVVP